MIHSYGNSKTIISYSLHNMHFPPIVLNSSSSRKTLNQSLQETMLNEIFRNCKVSFRLSNLIFQFRSLLKIITTDNHPEEQISITTITAQLVKWNHDISSNINWNIRQKRSTQMTWNKKLLTLIELLNNNSYVSTHLALSSKICQDRK